MLAEDDENIHRRAVEKILELRSEASSTTDMESSTLESSRKDVVWQFKVLKINVEATHFYELTNLDSIKDISQPPAVMDLDDTSIAQMLTIPLVMQHPRHNQAVERHVNTLAPGWFSRFSAKKTPKRTWLCGWISPLLFALATRRNCQNTRPV